jgi:putative transposase
MEIQTRAVAVNNLWSSKFTSNKPVVPMTHNLIKLYVHVVFCTKKRQPYLSEEIQEILFKYIGATCKNLDCWPIRIGGHKDHVHILCGLNKNISLSELVEEIKISSSRWLRNKNDVFRNFSWQQGYGGFSVGETDLPILRHYIETQREHHMFLTFEEEFKKLLVENEIEFDEALIWK